MTDASSPNPSDKPSSGATGSKTQKQSTPAKARKSSAAQRRSSESAANGEQLPILIKKYPNRRLYNTATSSYIVLDDIIDLVKSGAEFVIEDTKSGQDITRSILNQIIFEQETKPSDFHFPLEFQKQLISMYGDNYGKMVPDYLTEALRLFATERKQLADAVGSVLNRNTKAVLDYSQALAQQNMELFKRSVSMFTGPLGGLEEKGTPNQAADESTTGSTSSSGDREDALKDIQDQIDALQERLKLLR